MTKPDIGSSRYDDDADRLFRAHALSEGWFKSDPHTPGDGRGLWAYYRSIGVVPPEALNRGIPQHEFNNWKWGDDNDDL